MLLVIRYPIGLEPGAMSIAGLGPLEFVGSSFDSISCPCSPGHVLTSSRYTHHHLLRSAAIPESESGC